MPRGRSSTPKKTAAAAKNGAKASSSHTIRAARRRLGRVLSPKEERQVLDDAARYRKARADREQAAAHRAQTDNRLRDRELLKAAEVREWALKAMAGLRREIDLMAQLPADQVMDPAQAELLRPLIATVQQRMRTRLASIPELVPAPDPAAKPA